MGLYKVHTVLRRFGVLTYRVGKTLQVDLENALHISRKPETQGRESVDRRAPCWPLPSADV